MLARREMIDEVGGFNERFHMYSEDTVVMADHKSELEVDICSGSGRAASRRAELDEAVVFAGKIKVRLRGRV